jgi:hypothetical protein
MSQALHNHPAPEHPAVEVRYESVQTTNQRGLPTTGRAGEKYDLPIADCQRHVLHAGRSCPAYVNVK